jgi:DNA-binding NtrC family response regulator
MLDPVGRAPEAQRLAVLIVEDERVARRALKTLLAASGFETAAAESAEEALRILEGQASHSNPLVALVDLNLPGMNGLDFISRLERIDPEAVPVLMTAASDEVLGDAVRDRNLVYLRKPLDLGRLITVITHAEDAHKGGAAETRCGP